MSKYNWDEKHIITFPEEKVALSTKDLHVYYGKNESIKGIDMQFEKNKITALIGPSGSGKSTILNIIAGLLDATTGDILLDGVRINDIPTNKRDVHTVFQSYALFPHMNVFENVAFPLRLRIEA